MLTSVPQVSPDTQAPRLHLSDQQVTAQVLALSCPLCGSQLGSVNLYVGGRGFQPYDICQNLSGCEYQKRRVA